MDKLIAYAPLLAKGAGVTVTLALVSLALATLFGALAAAAKVSGGSVLQALATLYTTVMRGVPDLVLILLVYFGGQRLFNDLARLVGLEALDISKFWAGAAAISMLYGAYLAETFRGAWQTVPRGQAEAAQALGLPRWPVLRHVLLPQVLRLALPGYSNVWQVLVKSTAVVSVIGLQDLVGVADKAGKSAREPFLFFLAVILVYLVITGLSQRGFRMAETRLNRGIAA